MHTLAKPALALATLLAVAPAFAADAPAPATPSPKPDAATYARLAGEVEGVLKKDVLEKFFPAAEDKEGAGFFENFSANWSRSPNNATRSVVYQSRLTWLAAQAALFDSAQAATFKALSSHGIAELANLQWDKTNGGFFWAVNVGGNPTNQQKHAYGNAFAVYASAVNYSVTRDAAALDLAKKGFAWLEAHAHDTKNGGYIEAMNADGT
ncbi:MAG: AGE family epimerase/isomerase, partial [Verrucomicrobiota bacterium]